MQEVGSRWQVGKVVGVKVPEVRKSKRSVWPARKRAWRCGQGWLGQWWGPRGRGEGEASFSWEVAPCLGQSGWEALRVWALQKARRVVRKINAKEETRRIFFPLPTKLKNSTKGTTWERGPWSRWEAGEVFQDLHWVYTCLAGFRESFEVKEAQSP